MRGLSHSKKLQHLLNQGTQILGFRLWRKVNISLGRDYILQKGKCNAVSFSGSVEDYQAKEFSYDVYLLKNERSGIRILWDEGQNGLIQIMKVDQPRFKQNRPFQVRKDLRTAMKTIFEIQGHSYAWARAKPPSNDLGVVASSKSKDWRTEKILLTKDPLSGEKDYRTRLFKYWLTQIQYSYPANYISESELPDKLYIYSPKMLQGMGARALDTMESRIRGIVPWSFTDIST